MSKQEFGFEIGEIISHRDMCNAEDYSLQKGMNYRVHGTTNIFLMSTRKGAPFRDQIGKDGRVLIYEGHNIDRKRGGPDPYKVDQLAVNSKGGRTENGKFVEAVKRAAKGEASELVRVYEKLKKNIWVFRGVFSLNGVKRVSDGSRKVFRFSLELTDGVGHVVDRPEVLKQTRVIPSNVMQQVYARDKGRCVKCGSSDNLHFDHVLPFSKGGTSLLVENIQLLCARHNLGKRDRFE